MTKEFKSYIKNCDCFDEFKNIPNKIIDLVCVDLPYGQTACEWDTPIDLDDMWKELKRISKDNTIFVFFCTTKFGCTLINSNPEWFRYDLVWEKSKVLGFLSSKKLPLRKHEMVYIFSRSGGGIGIGCNLELREYAKKVQTYINKSSKEINEMLGNCSITRFFCHSSSQFSLPTKKTYDKLIEHYNIDKMEGFMDHETMDRKRERKTYNPQMEKGKPYKVKEYQYKVKECQIKRSVYGGVYIPAHQNESGDRYPTSIIKINNEHKTIHSTQKPTKLLEWIIKTYSNENDIVIDFTMGSGTTIEACINTNRKYIGIEKDKDVYISAKERIDNLL